MAALVGLPFSPLQWEELWLALASKGSARGFSPVEARKLQLLSMLVTVTRASPVALHLVR